MKAKHIAAKGSFPTDANEGKISPSLPRTMSSPEF